MLDRLFSLKVSAFGIRFFNKSTCFGGKKSFDSIVYYCVFFGEVKDDR